MLEYHGHLAVLDELRTTLAAAFSSDPGLASRVDELCAAVDDEPDAATLGACIDQVLAHASGDGVELELLESAATLWGDGLALYEELARTRQEIEGALLDPGAPGAIGLLRAGIGRLDGLRTGAVGIAAQVAVLKDAIAPLPHLDAHPRQTDVPSSDWGWRDAFLGRRTDAFVRQVFRWADTPRARALAVGVLAGYSANVAGAAYLGSVVGGPRRLHRFRNRLARNSVGAWLHSSLSTPDAADLAQRLRFTGPGGIVGPAPELAQVLENALAEAYPSRPLPDLGLGVRRAVRHLELLDMFVRPPLPQPPPIALGSSGPSSGGLQIHKATDELHPPGIEVGLDPDMSVGQPSTADSEKSSGGACLGILLALITIGIALLIYCIGKWSLDKKCDVDDFINEFQGSEEPDPTAPTGVGQQELTAMAKPDAAAHVAQELFNLQMLIWQGFDAALAYLAVTGLVYPDDLLLPSPLYRQFLSSPPREEWPLREESASRETYHLDPSSPTEAPAEPSPFPAGHAPTSFVVGWSSGHTASSVAAALLGQILHGDEDTTNYDLDADRGFLHACWSVAPGTSIADPVLTVTGLSYTEE